MRKITLIALTTAALPMAVQAANTEFSYGGFIKLDAMMTQYDGQTDIKSPTYYVPSQTPMEANGSDVTRFDTSVKSSRFNLKSVTSFDNGEKLTAFVEMDFLGGGGNGVTTNADHPRLRHAFFNYNNLTVGQTWSTFMNVGALPESVDLIGPSDGAVFVRQAQVRYDLGALQIAAEKAETTVDGIAQDAAQMPDLIARYNIKAGEHSFSVAALVRDLRSDIATDDSSLGFGVNAAGVIKLGADNIKFSASYGQIGRYVGVSAASDAIMVGTDLEATDVLAAYVSYQHFWNTKLRSTATYSLLDASYDNDTVAAALTEKSQSARVNLLYSPVASLTYGVEFSNAKRELVNGADGGFNRVHFTAKYSF